MSLIPLLLVVAGVSGDDLLVEAESFREPGGWRLDTQWIESMGSPYLLAHGLGTPVGDATTVVDFPRPGPWHVYVRTLDWVARWEAPGTPGRFRVRVGDAWLDPTFGTEGAAWSWHDGGVVQVDDPSGVTLTLHDLTGFDGRCDALWFTQGDAPPPTDPPREWRDLQAGRSSDPTLAQGYDLVVLGGGYAGVAASLSAARMGCRVALVQNRGVLGGNGSSEVRVWSMGHIRRGKFPRLGEIVEEFCDRATKSPGRAEEFGDAHKEAVVRAEPNINLYLHHHADQVEMEGARIVAVEAFDTRSGGRVRFEGGMFADCTGHGTIGFLAGADWDMTPAGRMGMSNMWRWDEADAPRAYPETPWALDLEMEDFPYPRDHHGQWFWESGYDKDPLQGGEAIRDWNLRAVYGAFQAMKNRGGADDHATAFLSWVAYVGGPRESRRLLGDVILTQDDVVAKRDFPDGCVPSTWTIDLHYPKEQFAKKYPDNPFISKAVHDRRIDRSYGYPVPYRCFYSRNIDNLFMAGRNVSVTHEALGTVRVMRTCGMMGEVVGRAASLCALHECGPREVWTDHFGALEELMRLPGKARRDRVTDPVTIPSDALTAAGPHGPISGIDPATLAGVVLDDAAAERIGSWTQGTGLEGYIGIGYHYAPGESAHEQNARVVFKHRLAEAGRYDVRLSWLAHENRGPSVPVVVRWPTGSSESRIDMRKDAPLEHGFGSLGTFTWAAGQVIEIIVGTGDAGGFVHADAVQIVRLK